MRFTHRDLTPRIGSQVETDRETLLSGACAAELRELLEHRGVVAIRGIALDDAQQVAITRTLGEMETTGVGEVYKVSFDKKDNPVGAVFNIASQFWHIDRTDLDVPPYASMLSAKVLTPTGGQTEFANTYAAYDDLPETEKAFLDNLKVVHRMETAFREAMPDASEKALAAWSRIPEKVHPLIWHHRSGRNSLVLSNSATAIVGMEAEEGRSLLRRLLDWTTRPEYVYVHEWQLDDLIIWNNTGTMHRVRYYDPDYGRRLHRTTVLGDEPFASGGQRERRSQAVAG